MKFFITYFIFAILFANSIISDTSHKRADYHAPIGVMGDHVHNKGEVMSSYRFMHMNMHGIRYKNNGMSTQQVYDAGFMKSPKKMQMSMHMLGLMFAPSDKFTVMFMSNYISNSMNINKRMSNVNTKETMSSSGLGDASITLLTPLVYNEKLSLVAKYGLTLPSGSLNKRNESGNRLPYPMQLGSGTVDLPLALTLTKFFKSYSTGFQLNALVRTDENKFNYRLGNIYGFSYWISKIISKKSSISLRLNSIIEDDIFRYDSQIESMSSMTPTATTKSGNRIIEGSIGLNHVTSHSLRISSELTFPIYRDFNSYQMENDWTAIIGIQKKH